MVRAPASALLGLALTSAAFGQFNFAEEFNGSFNNTWGTTPPIPQFDIAGASTYLGAPSGAFVTVDGVQTFRMTNTLSPRQIVGMTAAPTLIGPRGQITARINTLTQDGTRVDGLFMLILIDAQDGSKWMGTYLFGSNYSANRLFGFSSSFDAGTNYTVGYGNDTWYRLRLYMDGSMTAGFLLPDDESTNIIQSVLIPPTGYFSGQWKVGIGQFMGLPTSPLITDSAVDWVRAGPLACGPADVGVAGGLPGSDGALDNNDFVAFISSFFAADPIADRGVAGGFPGTDGQFDNNDFIVFITEFFEGC